MVTILILGLIDLRFTIYDLRLTTDDLRFTSFEDVNEFDSIRFPRRLSVVEEPV